MISYRSALFVLICFIFTTFQVFAGQCAATTKKGTQCKRQAAAGSQFCWQHGGKSESVNTNKSPESKNSDKEVLKKEGNSKQEYVSTQCQATTKKGLQCKRKPKAGSKYCWQHGG